MNTTNGKTSSSHKRAWFVSLGVVGLIGASVLAWTATAATGGERGRMAQPPKPMCQVSSADFGCFQPAAPEPGVAIPATSVTFGIRPYADNAFQVVGIKAGYFKDVGISIRGGSLALEMTANNGIPLMLNRQVDLGAMFGPTLVPTLKTQKKLKMVMFTDSYYGDVLLANPKLRLKSVEDYMKSGMNFKQALRKAVEPVVKANLLGTGPLVDTRPFIDLTFNTAGFKQPKFLIADSPKIVVLAQSGRLDFAVPDGAPQALQLMREGWTVLLNDKTLIDNMTGGPGSPVETVVGQVGVAGSADYVNANQNTTLRFVSAVFRTIDAIMKNPKALEPTAAYIAKFSGAKLNAKQLYDVFRILDPFVPYAQQPRTYFTDRRSAENYLNSYGALLSLYANEKILPKGLKPDDVIWARQVYDTLRWYQVRTDQRLATLAKKKLSSEGSRLVALSKKYYKWYDFLDAYRAAEAAAVAR